MPRYCGRPTIVGKTTLGVSSPAKPTLHVPDPLSTTKGKAAEWSSYMLINLKKECVRRQGTIDFKVKRKKK